MCRIRKAAEPPTAAQQRIVGAEANRFAMLTRLRRARGTFTSETSELFKPETANLSLSLGVPKGVFSFAKENIPFAPAARGRHILRTCAKPIASFILYIIKGNYPVLALAIDEC